MGIEKGTYGEFRREVMRQLPKRLQRQLGMMQTHHRNGVDQRPDRKIGEQVTLWQGFPIRGQLAIDPVNLLVIVGKELKQRVDDVVNPLSEF